MSFRVHFLLVVLTSFILFHSVTQVVAQETVNIQTPYGTVQGNSLENTNEFLGIPFAQPPIGDLRYAAPVAFIPPEPADQYLQDATKYKPSCLQRDKIYNFTGGMSEDCLYLDIYTPKPPQLKKNRNDENDEEVPKNHYSYYSENDIPPVMLWIHGGGFIGGSANQVNYNGSYLASSFGVVIVSISYRLGSFGFMADDAFCEEGKSCGMFGILDQQLAMQWVQQYISYFGGNPSNVTLWGESAGAMSVFIHLSLASSTGLFQAAIAESGIAEGYPSLEAAKISSRLFTEKAGCTSGDLEERRSCMLSQSSEALLATQMSMNMTWLPVINNIDLIAEPIAYIHNGEYNQVPVLMGCNSNEGWIFAMGLYDPVVLQDKYITLVEDEFGDFSSKVLELYPPVAGNNFGNLNNIIGDYLFVCPSFYVITSLNNEFTSDKQSYLYLFDHTPSWSIQAAGAFHTAELPFVWGYRPEGEAQFDAEEVILSQNMTTWWTDFAANKNPNQYSDLPFWSRYSLLNQRIVLNVPKVSYVTTYKEEECLMWADYEFYYQPPPTVHKKKFLTKLFSKFAMYL